MLSDILPYYDERAVELLADDDSGTLVERNDSDGVLRRNSCSPSDNYICGA